MTRAPVFALALCLVSPAGARAACVRIFDAGDWAIESCGAEPSVPATMEVVLGTASKGLAARVAVYHRSQGSPDRKPQVAVLYASGFVRLKPNADPEPPLPFGSSFILGPGYWPAELTYHHNPELHRLEIDVSSLPAGALRMRARGTNHAFGAVYEMTLPPPRDRQARLHVRQDVTATEAVAIDPVRRAEAQGLKLVQVSSMFINAGGTCDGGAVDCHDADAARYLDAEGRRRDVSVVSVPPAGFVFLPPGPLGSPWLDVLHSDDESWQGNTPNVRIALDELPGASTVTPQGYLSPTTDPNQDNFNVWLHDDGPASVAWSASETRSVSYWLLAQDDPPEPWADLGLRQGLTFLDFEGDHDCHVVQPPGPTASLEVIPGYTGDALELSYDGLEQPSAPWVQVRCDFDPPLDLSAYDHLRFDWRGFPGAGNSLEVGLVNPALPGENIFARGFHHATHRVAWGQLVLPFRFLHPWNPAASFDPSQVSALFVSVVRDVVDDVGGPGRLALDNLSAQNVAGRTVPQGFETVTPVPDAARRAAARLASWQRPTGLVKSWEEESRCVSHTYDQALALLAFDRGRRASPARALAAALAATQDAGGSWAKSRDCDTLEEVHAERWLGDIAWATYALSRHVQAGRGGSAVRLARDRGAQWVASQVNPADGCLFIDHTEGTIDAWWALSTAGPPFAPVARRVETCLLTEYWDDEMGRFKGGRDWWQPYLDNQTWGAAFLRAAGHPEKARRALAYARDLLRLPAQGGAVFGFDGQGGPWSVWNEGTAQYVAVGGEGARDLVQELLAQQRRDGALIGAPDFFEGAGVWTPRWHGVAPTAWLFHALTGGPFAGPAPRP